MEWKKEEEKATFFVQNPRLLYLRKVLYFLTNLNIFIMKAK